MSYQVAARVILDRHVIAVGVHDGKWWTAYIAAVPGDNHEQETRTVMENGTKLLLHVARVMFPRLAEMYEWRE